MSGVSCGGSSSRPTWTDSEQGGDSATIDNFKSAELTADVRGVFPPCQPTGGEDSAAPCVPLPCVEKDGKDGQWYVTLRVDSFDISPYSPQNELLLPDTPKEDAILREDDRDSDYWLHVHVANADEPETDLTCSADAVP